MVAFTVMAAAQTPDSLDRNRSKYATYSFSKDDQYTVEQPYNLVEVKQPRGKKIKNVIFRVCGIGMLCGMALVLLPTFNAQIFIAEAIALTFFGISWLVKGEFLGILSDD